MDTIVNRPATHRDRRKRLGGVSVSGKSQTQRRASPCGRQPKLSCRHQAEVAACQRCCQPATSSLSPGARRFDGPQLPTFAAIPPCTLARLALAPPPAVAVILSATAATVIESAAFVLALGYVLLSIRQIVWAWPARIVVNAVSVTLFIQTRRAQAATDSALKLTFRHARMT